MEKHEKGSRVLEEKKRARQDQEVKLNSLKEEMQKATEEMYSTMERMKSLRKQYVLSTLSLLLFSFLHLEHRFFLLFRAAGTQN